MSMSLASLGVRGVDGRARCAMARGIGALAVFLAGGAVAQDAAPRPAYKGLRFNEDWSAFDPAGGTDFWDPIKHVKLSEDGKYWASFGGSVRFRSESWENLGFAEPNDDSFLLGRVMLHADIHAGENVRVFLQGKSAFMPGDRDLPGGKRGLDVDSLALQNAFIDVLIPAGDDLSLTARVGRQELLFGKQRLVSPLPWSNTQRTWDAARVIAKVDRWQIDTFYSRFAAVQKYDFNDWRPGPDFYGIYAAGKVGPEENPLNLDVYFLGLSREMAAFNGSAGEEDRFTLGARLAGKIGESPFDFDVEAAYQFGDVGSADINAYMFASELGYKFEVKEFKPRAFVGFDYASGDDSPGDGEVETFNQLFPLGHAYFGYMDFVGRQNVIDLSAGMTFKAHEKVTVKLVGHMFWRASTDDALYNAGGGVVRAGSLGSDSEIGQEIDAVLTYKLDGHTTFQGGYSHFFPGEFIDQSGPSEDMDWLYLQVSYKF